MIDENWKEENKEFDRCLRCGRKLKNPEARKLGYGIICYNKVKYSHKPTIFSLHKQKNNI